MLQYATLQLSGRDLQIIYLALDELPGKISRELITRIQAIVAQQMKADAEKPP